MSDKPENKAYEAKAIQVIKGLDAVRKRPAMYIGSTGVNGLHHLVYEAVDNSVDEALAGYCSAITVTLTPDGACTVEDNGRGIPTDIHPTEGVSAIEVVMTRLHAGGKFDKDTYKFSGGLHGVGISVVNALSKVLEVEVFRDGKIYSQTFEKGTPLAPLKEIGTTKKRGTLVRFIPDPEIFQETTTFSFETLSSRLRELAFLNKGLRITIIDAINNKKNEFYFEGGIVSFVEHINAKKTPLFPEVIYIEQTDDKYVLEVAMQYNDGYGEQLYSFVNNINTVEGGTHVAGFKAALTKVCNKKGQEMGVIKGTELFSSDDVREGLVCIINIKVPEPQFEGQTKTKLGNSEVKGIVDSWTFAALSVYFEEHPNVTKLVLQKALLAQRARDAAKKARDLTRRKTALESSILPGKLADCTNEDPTQTELFIVEGDSAGGSAKQGRDRMNQAILPLKGKILNVEKARLDKMLSNDEIKALISAIGCGIGQEEFDANKARYHKIILMTDADVDGAHIRTLLLTFFFRYMKPVIERGYLYIAQPPLYKVKIGKLEQYIKDHKAFKQFLFDWAHDNVTLSINGKAVEAKQWNALLKELSVYDDQLTAAAIGVKIAPEQVHTLVKFMYSGAWEPSQGNDALLKALEKRIEGFSISLKEETIPSMGETVEEHYKAIVFRRANKEWSIELDFLSSLVMKSLIEMYTPLAPLEEHPWNMQVINKDRFITNQGVISCLNAIIAISKPYMHVQRYKGLGEMNPDQLWETSMDIKTRNLLKVKVEDELEADSWFATLMGDDVGGRKTFIEENGQFVKNLDV